MLKSFYFCKILKMREKILWNPQTFLFLFLLYKENMLTVKATIKSGNRRRARKSLVYIYFLEKSSPPLILRMYGGKKEISIDKKEKSFSLMSYFWFSPQNHQTEKYTYTPGKSLLSFNILFSNPWSCEPWRWSYHHWTLLWLLRTHG